MNYYRRYLGDYLKDTARLSLLEHGAYGLLLDYYYAEERPIPLDLDDVCRMLRAIDPIERRAVVKVLSIFFRKQDDGYHNARADLEIAKASSAIEQMSAAGKRGARARWDGHAGTDGVGNGVKDGVKDGVGNGVKDGVKDGVCNGVKGGVKDGVCNGVKGGVKDGVGNGVKGRVKDAGDDATTNHQPPTSSHQPPTAQPPAPISASAGRLAAQEAKAAKTRPAREAYSKAYERRWEVEPTWDKQANSCMASFVEKVGSDDAPGIAAFYVSNNRQDYVRAKHDVTLLLRDARGLRTEWLTRRQVTDTEARLADRTQATGNAFSGLLKEAARAQ